MENVAEARDNVWGKAFTLGAVLLIGIVAAMAAPTFFKEATQAQLAELQMADVTLRTVRVEVQKIDLGKGDPQGVGIMGELSQVSEAKLAAALKPLSKWERLSYRYRAWRLDSKAGL